jgi:ribonuclease HI
VYVPAHPGKQIKERALAVDCRYESQPGAPACVNTINRAELAAIQEAVEVGLQHCEDSCSTDVHIATNSLTSMYQVKKIINRPQDMREHRHLKLLQNIVQTITDSICQAHIWKVKSHVSIMGNERADETAVDVSNGLTAADHEDFQSIKMRVTTGTICTGCIRRRRPHPTKQPKHSLRPPQLHERMMTNLTSPLCRNQT